MKYALLLSCIMAGASLIGCNKDENANNNVPSNAPVTGAAPTTRPSGMGATTRPSMATTRPSSG